MSGEFIGLHRAGIPEAEEVLDAAEDRRRAEAPGGVEMH
jgi:hypothetical protein